MPSFFLLTIDVNLPARPASLLDPRQSLGIRSTRLGAFDNGYALPAPGPQEVATLSAWHDRTWPQ
jgi:hypothetical protein